MKMDARECIAMCLPPTFLLPSVPHAPPPGSFCPCFSTCVLLFPPCSLLPPLQFQCCHILSSLHHHSSRSASKVLLDPILLGMSSCKIAVFFSFVSHPSYDTPAYPVVLCIPLLQGLSIPLLQLSHCSHQIVRHFPVPHGLLLAAGREELALCNL